MIMSHSEFIYTCTALLVGVSVGWLISDVVRWVRLGNAPEAERHDRLFGYIIGIGISAVGIAGALRYHFG